MASLPKIRVSSNGVVHVYHAGSPGETVCINDPFLQYAALKQEPRADLSQNRSVSDSVHYSFTFGIDPVKDASWRDVSINCLLYDPLEAQNKRGGRGLIDPCHALSDLGNTDPASWSVESICPEVRIRPVALPADATRYWTAKALARVIKAAHKYQSADLGPAQKWLVKYASVLKMVHPQTVEVGSFDADAATLEELLWASFGDLGSDERETRHRAVDQVKAVLVRLTHDAPDLGWLTEMVNRALEKFVGPWESAQYRGVWPANAVGAAWLRLDPAYGDQAYSIDFDRELTAPDDDPKKAHDYWQRKTKPLEIKSPSIVAREGLSPSPMNAFQAPDGRLFIPLAINGEPVPIPVERNVFDNVRPEDQTRFAEFFATTDVLPVLPDFEAPDAKDPWWRERGLNPPKVVRSRPNPRQYDLTEEKMSTSMQTMEFLKRMRNFGFIEISEPDTDLYWACMNGDGTVEGGKVHITPLGRHYLDTHQVTASTKN